MSAGLSAATTDRVNPQGCSHSCCLNRVQFETRSWSARTGTQTSRGHGSQTGRGLAATLSSNHRCGLLISTAAVPRFTCPGTSRHKPTITVRVLEHVPALGSRLQSAAREWTERARGATLAFLNWGTADVSAAFVSATFQRGKEARSLVGADCKQPFQAAPTVNFRWPTSNSPDEEPRRRAPARHPARFGPVHKHEGPADGRMAAPHTEVCPAVYPAGGRC